MAEPQLSLAEARSQVRKVVELLESVRSQLLGLSQNLPQAPAEGQELTGEPEALRDLRATLECVLTDAIRPAIDDLQAVSLP